jgi:ribulose-phosphate 3-epimerase
MKKPKIAASLVCANMLELREEVRRIESGGADIIHFDVMDGSFVPRFGLHPEILSSVRSISKIPIDVHLMIDNPESYLKPFAEAGATYLTVHIEACKHIHRTLSTIKSLGVKTGIALNPGTGIGQLEEIIAEIDLVLLMAINPGIVGHKLIPSAQNKIRRCRDFMAERGLDIPIMIDGGVTNESAKQMIENGAEFLVCGSSTIFKPDVPVDQKILEFRNHINK